MITYITLDDTFAKAVIATEIRIDDKGRNYTAEIRSAHGIRTTTGMFISQDRIVEWITILNLAPPSHSRTFVAPFYLSLPLSSSLGHALRPTCQ
jgi:hypothetical protein